MVSCEWMLTSHRKMFLKVRLVRRAPTAYCVVFLYRKHIPHAKCEPNLPNFCPFRVGRFDAIFARNGVSEISGYFDSYS